MTESEFTNKLLKRIRELRPHAEIIKHCNPYSAGIPDFSVSTSEQTPTTRTTWCEVKLTSSRKIFQPLQLERLLRLSGWYVIYNTETRHGWLFPAAEREGWAKLEPLKFEELAQKIARMF